MSRDKKITVTPKKLDEIRKEVLGQSMILFAAYLMDEFDYDEDKIIALWDGVSRYAEAIQNKDITMRKICEIVNAHTGMNIRWNK